MLNKFIALLKQDRSQWEQIKGCFKEIEIPSKTTLLKEGEISKNIFFVKKGCLRHSYNKEGKDITFQFFLENQSVASFDSFFNNQPSIFSIQSIEPSVIISIRKEEFEKLIDLYPESKDLLLELLLKRFSNYTQLFLSRIKDSPQERYEDLLKNHPQIIERIPQHYIASYLGITTVSLSRIRNRI